MARDEVQAGNLERSAVIACDIGENLFRVNLIGMSLVTREAIPMIRASPGFIINTASP